MKWIKIAFATIVFSQSAFAATESMKVMEIQWEHERQAYRVHFHGRAGAYFAPQSLQDCLIRSIKEETKASIEFNPKDLQVISCKNSKPIAD